MDHDPTRPSEPDDRPTIDPSSQRTTRSTEPKQPGAIAQPESVGPYKTLEVLGEGGMGIVYRAEQAQPRREVALKLIRPGLVSGTLLKRFQLEADILARLQHPGIAQVYQAGLHEGTPYFAMELIEGESLTKYARINNLSVKERLELFAKICDAVQHAHQKGIVHRDLKPGNILVDASGQPKILDFGVARATDGDIQTTTIQTDIGQLIGTIPYMSPEQASGDPDDIDTRSDVYALGVILYELLSGRLPYDLSKKLVHEAVRIIREEDPTRLSSIHKTLRGDIETIVGKALEKEKERRYQSASAISADVRRYLSDEPIAARPPSASYQLRKFTKRNKGLVTGVAAVFVVLVAGVIASTTFAVGQARARADAEEAQALAQTRLVEADAARDAEIEQREIAEDESENAKAINDFLTNDLLAAVAPSAESGKGRDVLMRDVLDEASKKIDEASGAGGKFDGKPLVEASIRAALGRTYWLLGQYQQAEPHIRKTLELRKRILGEEHPDTLSSMNNLAGLYLDQGRYNEAEPLYIRTLELSKRILGEEHPETLDSMNNLALLYWKQWRYDEAEPLSIRTLELRKRILGEEHPKTLNSMNSLAVLYANQGRSDEAEPLYIRALELKKRILGEEHPHTLESMNNLAVLYENQGRYDEAELLYIRTLELSKRILGEEHPMTLGSMNNLAYLYLSQGRYDEAEPLYIRTLEHQKNILGEEHPDTLVSMNNLGILYSQQGRHEDARPLLQRLIEHERRQAEQLGASADDKNSCAWRLLTCEPEDLRDPEAALRLAREVVDMTGAADPNILDTLALAQHMTGDTAGAIETEKKALTLLPADSPARGDYEAAIARFEAALVEGETPAIQEDSPISGGGR